MRKPTEEEENYIRENLRYDPETGHLWWIKHSDNPLSKRRRRLDKPVGYKETKGYLCLNLFSTTWKCHRLAWFLYYGCWPKEVLDHINGIRVDNKIENLREATQNQNEMNKKKKTECSSNYKGVWWCVNNKTWRARIRNNGTSKNLGSYTSEEAAACAYDKAARELHGDYARLNFPEEHEQGAVHGYDI